MKKAKKAMALILSVIMVLSMTVVSASAAGANTITIGNMSGKAGTTVSVPVTVNLNTAAAGIGFAINYDSNMTLVSVTANRPILNTSDLMMNLSYHNSGHEAKFLVNWCVTPKNANNGTLLYLNFAIKSNVAKNAKMAVSFETAPSQMMVDSNCQYINVTATNGTVAVS